MVETECTAGGVVGACLVSGARDAMMVDLAGEVTMASATGHAAGSMAARRIHTPDNGRRRGADPGVAFHLGGCTLGHGHRCACHDTPGDDAARQVPRCVRPRSQQVPRGVPPGWRFSWRGNAWGHPRSRAPGQGMADGR